MGTCFLIILSLLLGLLLSSTRTAMSISTSSASTAAASCFPGQEDHTSLSMETLLEGATNFGLSLFAIVAREATLTEQNSVMSPFSAWGALLLAYTGAHGPAQQELRRVLRLGETTQADAARAYKTLRYWYALRGDQRVNYTLHVANRLFVDRTIHLRSCIQNFFADEIEHLDLVRSPEAARKTINTWIEERTRGRIQELFPPGSVSSSSPLALVNAAYFSGRWRTRFPINATIQGATFKMSPTRHVKVQAMRLTASLYYVHDELDLQLEALELPFASEELSALLLLPIDPVEQLDLLAARLTSTFLRRLRQKMGLRRVAAWIPRFVLQESVDLRPAISAMGASSLFDPAAADLGGFFETAEDGKLSLGAVRHKAFLAVDEKGGEAAAATGALAWRSARPAPQDDPVHFIANRPFIFLLHDNLSNTVMFAATVVWPEDAPNDVRQHR